MCAPGFAFFIAGFLVYYVGLRRVVGTLRQRLDDRRCLYCDYDVSESEHGRCPECGRETPVV